MNKLEIDLLDTIATPVFVLEPDDSNRPVYAAFNATARKTANLELTQIVGKTALELYPGAFGQIAYNHHCEV